MQIEGNLVSDDDDEEYPESSRDEQNSLAMDQELDAKRKASGRSISKKKQRA